MTRKEKVRRILNTIQQNFGYYFKVHINHYTTKQSLFFEIVAVKRKVLCYIILYKHTFYLTSLRYPNETNGAEESVLDTRLITIVQKIANELNYALMINPSRTSHVSSTFDFGMETDTVTDLSSALQRVSLERGRSGGRVGRGSGRGVVGAPPRQLMDDLHKYAMLKSCGSKNCRENYHNVDVCGATNLAPTIYESYVKHMGCDAQTNPKIRDIKKERARKCYKCRLQDALTGVHTNKTVLKEIEKKMVNNIYIACSTGATDETQYITRRNWIIQYANNLNPLISSPLFDERMFVSVESDPPENRMIRDVFPHDLMTHFRPILLAHQMYTSCGGTDTIYNCKL
uniref:Uncharacterized protein n=1 Tax=viral metagenome TaxID=1070528 RepID=A0A6C0CSV5_9ZZZZ